MKISFIMPTYNDADTIEESINSLINQSNENWELILVNDGSYDNTGDIVTKKYNEFLGGKIKYIYQDNNDQLNAIINGIKHITGDYVMIFHSDDLLPHNSFLDNVFEYINKYPQSSFFLGDLIVIDGKSEIIGSRKITKCNLNNQLYGKLLLHLGRNLLCDVGIFQRKYFEDIVFNNYLLWNMPFWVGNMYDSEKNSNVEWSVLPEPILKYRINGNNYINSDIGVLNVLNGELRTLVTLLKYYDIPAFRLQVILYNVMKKIKLDQFYRVWYRKTSFKHPEKIIKLATSLRLKKELQKDEYFSSILEFYNKESDRKISISIPQNIDIYFGKDMRNFNKKLQAGNLEKFYFEFMNEMKNGFKVIEIKHQDRKKLEDILKFFDIYDCIIIKEI